MRSLRHQMYKLLLGSLVILAFSIILILGWYMKDRDIAAATTKAQADLATCMEIVDAKYPGPWSVREGLLYKGDTKISLNNDMVDHLALLTGDNVTIFLGDTRAATTIRGSNGERVIGSKVSANVSQTVLTNGQTYIGEADVVGQRYQTAYAPLRAENGNIVGMFYVGISHVYEQEFINRSLITMAGLVLALTILVAFFAWLLLRRLARYAQNDNLLGTRKAGDEYGDFKGDISVILEKEKLEDVLNQMAEQIQTLTGEISRSNNNNPQSTPLKSDVNTVLEQLKAREESGEQAFEYTISNGSEPLSPLDTPWCSEADVLPKGLNKATLDQIVHYLQTTHRPISTEEVAEGVKLTRVTVRRYLEFLEERGALKSEQKCGTVGRPVKIFIPL